MSVEERRREREGRILGWGAEEMGGCARVALRREGRKSGDYFGGKSGLAGRGGCAANGSGWSGPARLTAQQDGWMDDRRMTAKQTNDDYDVRWGREQEERKQS